MPAARDILLGLARIANGATAVAVAWHVAVVGAVLAILLGFRPKQQLAALLLSLPLASVAALAFADSNSFNGAVFSGLTLSLAVLARRAPCGRVTLRVEGWSALGALLVAFGFVYPHFLQGASWLTYLYAAPLGTLPCPTLSLVIGAALMMGGPELCAWRRVLAVAGGFYAVFGAVRLGVVIDLSLLGGAVGLFAQSLRAAPRSARHAAVST
jgi:hypothetical protein